MNAEHDDLVTVPAGGGAPEAPDGVPVGHGPVPAAIVVAATVAAALILLTALALTAPDWGALWSRLSSAVAHHVDTVVATVLLAGALAAVWRLSGEER
ncbi:MAG TPA: hypothetical protein VFX70_02840 [Mycobacteriales bacterium]|nr:hypothetical protein [Mycobacteriales bacterium]